MHIYIYIYTHTYTDTYIYIYIHIYIPPLLATHAAAQTTHRDHEASPRASTQVHEPFAPRYLQPAQEASPHPTTPFPRPWIPPLQPPHLQERSESWWAGCPGRYRGSRGVTPRYRSRAWWDDCWRVMRSARMRRFGCAHPGRSFGH